MCMRHIAGRNVEVFRCSSMFSSTACKSCSVARVLQSVCNMLVTAAYQHFACIQEMKLRSATLGTCQVKKTCGKGHWEWLGILRAPAHAVQLKRRCIGKLRARLTVLGLRQTGITVMILTDTHIHTGTQQALHSLHHSHTSLSSVLTIQAPLC